MTDKTYTNTSHLMDKKKSEFNRPGKTDFVVAYHQADVAGPHLDIHFPSYGTSLGINLKNKIDPDELEFSNGSLSKKSRQKLVDILKNDILKSSARTFINYDHALGEARIKWPVGESPQGYGSGKIRDIILDSRASVVPGDKSTTLHIPDISPKPLYAHRLQSGNYKPTMIIGVRKEVEAPELQPRLKLKNITESQMSEIDPSSITLKEDSASAYIHSDEKGTRLFSPRTSKRTGKQIEYTSKFPEIAALRHKSGMTGMGELLIMKNGKQLPSNKVSGILNSSSIPSHDISPVLKLYRIDALDGKKTSDVGFHENRALQKSVAKQFRSPHISVVEPTTVEKARASGAEGIVAVPRGGNIGTGVKLKFRDKYNDWRLDSIDFKPGAKGGIAGTAAMTSLESGKTFKMGPSQIGSHSVVKQMMANPEEFTGRVYKVKGARGHEGRAAKIVEEHMDKGMSDMNKTAKAYMSEIAAISKFADAYQSSGTAFDGGGAGAGITPPPPPQSEANMQSQAHSAGQILAQQTAAKHLTQAHKPALPPRRVKFIGV